MLGATALRRNRHQWRAAEPQSCHREASKGARRNARPPPATEDACSCTTRNLISISAAETDHSALPGPQLPGHFIEPTPVTKPQKIHLGPERPHAADDGGSERPPLLISTAVKNPKSDRLDTHGDKRAWYVGSNPFRYFTGDTPSRIDASMPINQRMIRSGSDGIWS